MQAACLVVTRVLDELKSRDSYLVERFVVRRAGVAHADGGDAQVFQRHNPLVEDGNNGCVVLGIDAQHLSSAIVQIEVAGNKPMLGFDGQWANRFPQVLRNYELFGLRRQSDRSEMPVYIAKRAEFALFLA